VWQSFEKIGAETVEKECLEKKVDAKYNGRSMCYARFPPFRCRSSVAVSPFPLAVAIAYLFAVYGCNGTAFSYVIFTERRNFLQRHNGETATEERQRNGGNRALHRGRP